ncbi:MAG: VWA domain-containing protein, partial [Vicinamibacteria bacterium]
LDFDENIRLSEYSSDDQRQIAERVYGVEAKGWTALYDAVGTVLDRVYHYDGQKTIVVFSDGVGSRSTLGIGDCLEMVKDSSVTIHAIHFGGAQRNPSRLFTEGRFLRQISKLSGGSYAVATSLEQIDEFYDRILEELFSQYTLGYISTNTKRDGSYRKIKVEVARKGVKVRAREGYTGPFDEPDEPDKDAGR